MKYDNFLVIIKESLKVHVLDASLVDLWEGDILSSAFPEKNVLTKCEMRANVRILPRMTMFHREQSTKDEKEDEEEQVVTMILVSLSAVTLTNSASSCTLFPFQLVAFDAQNGDELWRYEESKTDNEKFKPSFDQVNVSTPLEQPFSSFSIPSIRLPRSSSFYDEIRHHLEKESPQKMSSISSSSSLERERSTNDWLSMFRTSLLRSGFPHFWRNLHDTRLSLTFFEQDRLVGDGGKAGKDSNNNHNKGRKKGQGKRKNNQKEIPVDETKRKEIKKRKSLISLSSSSTSSSLLSSLTSTLNSSSSSRPAVHHYHHHRQAKIVQPNVALYHSKEGLRIIALQTGKLLFSLSFEENILYGDLNHDGNIESFLFGLSTNDIKTEIMDGKYHLSIISKKAKQLVNDSSSSANPGGEDGEDEQSMCLFSVISGYPVPHSLLFTNADSPLCEMKRENEEKRSAKQRRRSKKYQNLSPADFSSNPSSDSSFKITSTPLLLHSSPTSVFSSVDRNHLVEHHEDSSLSSNVAIPAFSSSSRSSKDPARHVSFIVGNNIAMIHGYNSYGQVLWKQSENSFYSPSSANTASFSSSDSSSLDIISDNC
jgi:hypothetical protein